VERQHIVTFDTPVLPEGSAGIRPAGFAAGCFHFRSLYVRVSDLNSGFAAKSGILSGLLMSQVTGEPSPEEATLRSLGPPVFPQFSRRPTSQNHL